MENIMSSTDKRYLEMMEELKPHIKTSYLGNLKQWPSKIKSLDEIKSLTSKSGRFAAEKFNGKRYGLYFDFFREIYLGSKFYRSFIIYQ